MNYNVATEALISKRLQLITERDNMLSTFNQEISQIETSIELLEGKKVWEISMEERFDDLSPNYIRSSQEEI